MAFADKNGKRQSTETNEYELRFKYDEKKNLLLPIEIANYGKSDSLQNNSHSYAKITFKYDDKNRIIEESVFGADESLQECSVGPVHNIGSYYRVQSYNYAVAKYQYSENELRPQKISFFGKDEQPLATGNVASVKVSYTPEGMYAQREYLGIDDTPVEGGDEVHQIAPKTVFSYDDVGNLISEKYYGIDGNPTCIYARVNGFDIISSTKMAEKRIVYDSKRRPTEATFFDTSGDPIDVKGYYYEAGNSADYYVRRAVIEYNDIEDEKAKIIGKEIWYDKDGKELCRQNKERM